MTTVKSLFSGGGPMVDSFGVQNQHVVSTRDRLSAFVAILGSSRASFVQFTEEDFRSGESVSRQHLIKRFSGIRAELKEKWCPGRVL
jgi:hypothetical protein